MLPDFDSFDLSTFRFKTSTSAPFSAALKADVVARWPGVLVEFYGMTEGTSDGNKVSFILVGEFNGNQFTHKYQGTLTDSGELDLSVSMGGGARRSGGGGGFGGGEGGQGGRGGQRTLVFKKAAN